MIHYIRGTLVDCEEDKAIVDVGGVGYGIFHGRYCHGHASASGRVKCVTIHILM